MQYIVLFKTHYIAKDSTGLDQVLWISDKRICVNSLFSTDKGIFWKFLGVICVHQIPFNLVF